MLMLLGSRLCLFELVEHGLGGDVAGDLLQVGVGFGLDPIRSAIPDTSVTSLVISCSASRLNCRSRSARMAAAAAMRFWLVRTKVDLLQACGDVPFSKKASETGTAIHVEPFTQPS